MSIPEKGVVEYSHAFHVVFFGDSGVGKTSMLLRFVDDTFVPNTRVSVESKDRVINFDGKYCKFKCWDSAGQELFRTVTSSFSRKAHGIVLVYDVTDRQSFKNVKSWLEEMERGNPGMSPKSVILVGNKTDLKNDVAVRTEEGQKMAAELGLQRYHTFFEVSAKDGDGIDQAFKALGRAMLKQKEDSDVDVPLESKKSNIILDDLQSVKSKKTCWCF